MNIEENGATYLVIAILIFLLVVTSQSLILVNTINLEKKIDKLNVKIEKLKIREYNTYYYGGTKDGK